MNPIMRSVLVLLIFAALTVYSATRAGEQKSVEEILANSNLIIVEEVKFLPGPYVRGWQKVNKQNVVLEVVQSKLYLVELNKPCDIFESATNVTLGTGGRTVYKNDSIIVRPGKGRRNIGFCQIKAIYRLENTGSKTDSTN
jgi:hypothetical protein